MDQMAEAGFTLIELGPHGYLPTDPTVLKEELDRRSLNVSATFAMGPLDTPDDWPSLKAEVIGACTSLVAVGGQYLILIDGTYSDLITGQQIRPRELDDRGWQALIDTTHRVARIVSEDFGLQLVFHPHAETHVEYVSQIDRFMSDTDPNLVNLCLDTGHVAYRGGDPLAVFDKHRDRVHYMHLKSVDGKVRDALVRTPRPFAEAVAQGVFCEPSRGVVDFRALGSLVRETEYQGVAIAEQDLYPANPEIPLPLAKSTLAYLHEVGF